MKEIKVRMEAVRAFQASLKALKDNKQSVKHVRLEDYLKLITSQTNLFDFDVTSIRSQYKDSIRGDQFWRHVVDIFLGVVIMSKMNFKRHYTTVRLADLLTACTRYVENHYANEQRPIPLSLERVRVAEHPLFGLEEYLQDFAEEFFIAQERGVFGDTEYTADGERKFFDTDTRAALGVPDHFTAGQRASLENFEKDMLSRSDMVKISTPVPAEPVPEVPTAPAAKQFTWSTLYPEWHWNRLPVGESSPPVYEMTDKVSYIWFVNHLTHANWVLRNPDIARFLERYGVLAIDTTEVRGLWGRVIQMYAMLMRAQGLIMVESLFFGVHCAVLEEAVIRVEVAWEKEFDGVPMDSSIAMPPRPEPINDDQLRAVITSTQAQLQAVLDVQKANQPEGVLKEEQSIGQFAKLGQQAGIFRLSEKTLADAAAKVESEDKEEMVRLRDFVQEVLNRATLAATQDLQPVISRYDLTHPNFKQFWSSVVLSMMVRLSPSGYISGSDVISNDNALWIRTSMIQVLKECAERTEKLYTAAPIRGSVPLRGQGEKVVGKEPQLSDEISFLDFERMMVETYQGDGPALMKKLFQTIDSKNIASGGFWSMITTGFRQRHEEVMKSKMQLKIDKSLKYYEQYLLIFELAFEQARRNWDYINGEGRAPLIPNFKEFYPEYLSLLQVTTIEQLMVRLQEIASRHERADDLNRAGDEARLYRLSELTIIRGLGLFFHKNGEVSLNLSQLTNWMRRKMSRETIMALAEAAIDSEDVGVFALLEMDALARVEMHVDNVGKKSFLVTVQYDHTTVSFKVKGPVKVVFEKCAETIRTWLNPVSKEDCQRGRVEMSLGKDHLSRSFFIHRPISRNAE